MTRKSAAEVERFHLRRDADQVSRVTLFSNYVERDRTFMVVGSAAITLTYRSPKSSHSSWISFWGQVISVPDHRIPTMPLLSLQD